MRNSTARIALGIGVAFAVFVGFMLGAGPSASALVAPLGSLGFGLTACGLGFRAAFRASGRQRSAWTMLAVGLGAWALGDAVWAILVIGASPIAHGWWLMGLGYLLLPVAGLAAAALVPASGGFGVRLVLDGLLVTASLVMIAVIAAHYLDLHVDGSWLISGPFTACYLALAVVTGVVAAKASLEIRWSPGFAGMGFLIVGATGAINSYFSVLTGQPSAFAIIGWSAGLCSFSLAALLSRPGPDLDMSVCTAPSLRNQWFIYVLLAVAVALGAVYLWPGHGVQSVAFGIGLVIVAMALWRQFLLLGHNRQLQLTAENASRRHPVTGLATRGLLDESLSESIKLHSGNHAPTSLIAVRLIDFAMFKAVVGYPTDDELLHEAGTRLLANSHPGVTVTHVGEDTFAVLIAGGQEAAHDVASRIVAAFGEPFEVAGKPMHVDVRYGIATEYPDVQRPAVNGQSHAAADGLLAQALSALKPADPNVGVASALSSHRPSHGDPSRRSSVAAETTRSAGLDRLRLMHELRQAVCNSELALVYQPKYDLQTGELCGAEALVRWPHRELGVLPPAEFLPLINELELADELTHFVLHRAMSDAAVWNALGPTIPIAVNLSAPSLIDQSLPQRVTSLLEEYQIAAHDLTIEITEDVVIADLEKARNVLRRLYEAGVRIAIDDFGSGYGSMTYLQALPVNDIKIDRQFIAPMVSDPRAAAIVKSTIELANSLQLAVTAEGVEDEATANKLKQFGCHFVQGYYFSRPVSAAVIRSAARGTAIE